MIFFLRFYFEFNSNSLIKMIMKIKIFKLFIIHVFCRNTKNILFLIYLCISSNTALKPLDSVYSPFKICMEALNCMLFTSGVSNIWFWEKQPGKEHDNTSKQEKNKVAFLCFFLHVNLLNQSFNYHSFKSFRYRCFY